METIVRYTMNDYLDDNNLLSVSQHGFRNKHFTVLSLLLSQNNYVNCIEDKEDINVIFFNFFKAFVAVNHNLLLKAL